MNEQPQPPDAAHPSDHQSLFHQQQPKKQQADEQSLALSRQVADLLSRLRLLEGRYANIRREHQITSENMIENHQNLSKQQRKLQDSIVELKRNLREIQEQLGNMQGELADAASSYDLKAIERYIDLWQPLNFLTREQAENMLNEAINKPRKFYKEQE